MAPNSTTAIGKAATAILWATLTASTATATLRQEPGEHVQVYLSNCIVVNVTTEAKARALATAMFSEIGVQIDWHMGRPPAHQKDVIGIEFTTSTPASLLPGALAYARPYEGVHIRIFWDRIQPSPAAGRLLGHVLVHEITHILEGVARHSEEGIMKAYWSPDDFSAITGATLRFAPIDIRLIHLGLQARASGTTMVAAHPELVPAEQPAAVIDQNIATKN